MKKSYLVPSLVLSVLILSLTLISCSGGASTDVSGSWKKPGYTGKKYNNLLVLALSDDEFKRNFVETALVKELKANKINSTSASSVIDYNSLEMSKGKLDTAKKQEIKAKLEAGGFDGVVVVSLLDIKEKTEYIPGQSYYQPSYAVGPGFYNYWYSTYNVINTPGYTVNKTYVYIETRLFELSTEDMVWATTTTTNDPKDLKEFAASFANATVTEMLKKKAVR